MVYHTPLVCSRPHRTNPVPSSIHAGKLSRLIIYHTRTHNQPCVRAMPNQAWSTQRHNKKSIQVHVLAAPPSKCTTRPKPMPKRKEKWCDVLFLSGKRMCIRLHGNKARSTALASGGGHGEIRVGVLWILDPTQTLAVQCEKWSDSMHSLLRLCRRLCGICYG